jgi:hypothetical protein
LYLMYKIKHQGNSASCGTSCWLANCCGFNSPLADAWCHLL